MYRFMQMSRLGTYRGQTVLAYESKSFDDVVVRFYFSKIKGGGVLSVIAKQIGKALGT